MTTLNISALDNLIIFSNAHGISEWSDNFLPRSFISSMLEKSESVFELIASRLFSSENLISTAVLKNLPLSSGLKMQAEKELEILTEFCDQLTNHLKFKVDLDIVRIHPNLLKSGTLPTLNELILSYETKGAGEMFGSAAFKWTSENVLAPITNLSPIRLEDLKEYTEEKEQVLVNTSYFLKNLPASNVLLYGDRGTGKSSTVHAILNIFAPEGLRLIELPKNMLSALPKVFDRISEFKKLKFIIFLDDLVLQEGTDEFSFLKAVLEGSVTKVSNALIYATSNRRHLIKESHAERSDDVHFSDSVEEKLSLSDRFGLTITFMNPGKREFFTILKSILLDANISLPDDFLSLRAEQFALAKGGRSPRAARQLANQIISEAKSKEN